jgi:hypothetical protein
MRTCLAASAALIAVLALAACSGPAWSDDAAPAASSSTSSAPVIPGPEPISTAETCAGYYDGDELSLDHRVTTWGPQLGSVEESAVVEVTIVRDRLDALLRYAGEETTPQLQAIQVPFKNALANGTGDPARVEEAAAGLRTTCEAAGYAF